MSIISRRSLIIGGASLFAAPALVKASSLMPLRGYDMDPWVIGYFPDSGHCAWHNGLYSWYNIPRVASMEFGGGRSMPISQKIAQLNDYDLDYQRWRVVRLSELDRTGTEHRR